MKYRQNQTIQLWAKIAAADSAEVRESHRECSTARGRLGKQERMYYRGQDPKWLQQLSRHMRWLAVPNIAVIFITLQVLGFLSILTDPVWFERLLLDPGLVLDGQVWRLITFLALPLSTSPLWMIFALWFLYFVITLIESQWGDFKTTLYFLVSIVVTIVFSLLSGYPVAQVQDFSSTLFLAAATLFPEMEIRLYFALPVKMKWLGWLTLGYFAFRLVGAGSFMSRLYLLAIYSNYLLFFGPALVDRARQWKRQRAFRGKFR